MVASEPRFVPLGLLAVAVMFAAVFGRVLSSPSALTGMSSTAFYVVRTTA
jgi:hypothetical protein